MKAKSIKLNDNNLHVILNDNYKTTRVEARFTIDMEKKEVPLLELLSNLLVYTSKKYNTRKSFINKCKDLYDLSIGTVIKDDGNRTYLDFSITFLDGKYSSDSLFEESIDFLKEVIYNPNVINDGFDNESYEAVKTNILSELDTIIEDKSTYSRLRLLEIINEENDNYISRVNKEYKKIVDESTNVTIYDFYKKIIDNSKLDFIVFGNVDYEKTEKVIKERFNNTKHKEFNIEPNRYYASNKKVVNRFESDKSSQAKLNIACFLDDSISSYEKEIIMPIYDIMLGGFANSLLFKNVREKHSLCYYIVSHFLYFDNIIIIRSGINKDNYDQVITLIKKEIKNLSTGKVPTTLLEDAKETYISNLKSAMDMPASIVNNYFDNKNYDISLFEDRIEKINNVTMGEIKKVASKVKIDTVYLFGGDSK